MRKHYNLIIYCIVLLLCLILLLPLCVGIWFQQKFPKFVSNLGKAYGGKAHVITYQRGWFTSHAVISVLIPAKSLKQNQKAHFLTINEKIWHGPYVFSRINGYKKLHFATALVETKFSNQYGDLKAITTLHFDGSYYSILHSNHLTLPRINHIIRISGINWQFTLSHNSRLLSSNLKLSNLEETSRESNVLPQVWKKPNLKIRNLNYVLQVNDKHQPWQKQQKLNASSITVSKNRKNTIQLSQIMLSEQSKQIQRGLAVSVKLSARSLQTSMLIAQPFTLKASIKGINTSIYQKLIQQARSVLHNQDTKKMQRKLESSLTQLLASGLSVNLDYLHLNTPQGLLRFSGYGSINSKAITRISDLASDFVGQLKLSLPKQWLEKQLSHFYTDQRLPVTTKQNLSNAAAMGQINYWVAHKKLVRDKDNLNAVIKVNNGKLFINGIQVLSINQ